MGLTGQPETKLVGGVVEWVGDGGLKVYLDHFEPKFLERAREDYAKKGAGWISTFNVLEYLLKIDESFTKAERNALEASTQDKLSDVMVATLVSRQAQTLAEHHSSGCRYMFEHGENSQLQLMYKCF